jgi:hypothetical protein
MSPAPQARKRVARGQRAARRPGINKKYSGPQGRQKNAVATLSAAPSGLNAFRGRVQARRALQRFALAPGNLLDAPSALTVNHSDMPLYTVHSI